MKITIYVPKKGEKWEANIGHGGTTFKRVTYSSLREHVAKRINRKLSNTEKEKIKLVVDYYRYHTPCVRGEWINESVSIDAEKVLLDLDYFTEDFR